MRKYKNQTENTNHFASLHMQDGQCKRMRCLATESALFIIWIIRHRWQHNMWTWLKWKLMLLIIFHVQCHQYATTWRCLKPTDTRFACQTTQIFQLQLFLWSTWEITRAVLLQFWTIMRFLWNFQVVTYHFYYNK